MLSEQSGWNSRHKIARSAGDKHCFSLNLGHESRAVREEIRAIKRRKETGQRTGYKSASNCSELAQH